MPPTRLRAVSALVTVQLLFGVHYSLAQKIMAVIPPPAWAGLRAGGAALVLALAYSAARRPWPRGGRDWGILTGLALFGVVLNQLLFLEGLSRSTTIHSVLIMASVPLQTLFLSVLFRQERLDPVRLGSVVLGGFGILLLLRVDQILPQEGGAWLLRADGTRAESFAETVLLGDLMMLTNAASFSLFLVLSKFQTKRFDSFTLTTGTFVPGGALILLYAAPHLARTDFAAVSPLIWGYAAFSILGPTVGSYFLNFYAMRAVAASTVGLFIYLQFVIAAIGVVWLGEAFDPRLVLSSALVLGGLALRVLGRRR